MKPQMNADVGMNRALALLLQGDANRRGPRGTMSEANDLRSDQWIPRFEFRKA